MSDRIPLAGLTGVELDILYDQRDRARRTAATLKDRLTTVEDERDQARDIAVALEQELARAEAEVARLSKAEAADAVARSYANRAAEAERQRLRTRLGAALASVRLLHIYADGLDHGREVGASDVARRIRRILAGLDDRPTGDPEPQRQLTAAIEALGVSETENAELRARIATLEHVAAGNKRHVQHLIPELERAVAERDQHAAQLAAVHELHQPGKDWSWKEFGCTHDGAHAAFCVTCRHCHPCPTIRALDTALAGPTQPPAAAQAESHSCGNCEGIDPDTCLMSPNSPPEQCPAARADTALCRCGHTRKQHQDNTGLGGAQCRVCPGDEERSWRHPYTPTERSAR